MLSQKKLARERRSTVVGLLRLVLVSRRSVDLRRRCGLRLFKPEEVPLQGPVLDILKLCHCHCDCWKSHVRCSRVHRTRSLSGLSWLVLSFKLTSARVFGLGRSTRDRGAVTVTWFYRLGHIMIVASKLWGPLRASGCSGHRLGHSLNTSCKFEVTNNTPGRGRLRSSPGRRRHCATVAVPAARASTGAAGPRRRSSPVQGHGPGCALARGSLRGPARGPRRSAGGMPVPVQPYPGPALSWPGGVTGGQCTRQVPGLWLELVLFTDLKLVQSKLRFFVFSPSPRKVPFPPQGKRELKRRQPALGDPGLVPGLGPCPPGPEEHGTRLALRCPSGQAPNVKVTGRCVGKINHELASGGPAAGPLSEV
jgi:hypothetical protein